MRQLRILFISGVDVGGAPHSTRELADALALRGHEVTVTLGRTATSAGPFDVGVRGAVKLQGHRAGLWVRALLRPFGTRTTRSQVSRCGVEVHWMDHPENAIRRMVQETSPDVVVANSFPREQLQWMARDLGRAGVPFALYLREQHAVTHLSVSGLRPSLVLANSRHLTEACVAVGVPCVFAPSLVDVSQSTVESSRTALTLVNPVVENRPSILRDLADRRPDIPCVLQESWPLQPPERRRLQDWAASRSNLELRPPTPDSAAIYRDARMLVATYPTGRPRVVLEAQSNGIPVIGLAQPALLEAIGGGGITLSTDCSDEDWVARIESLWDDVDRYAELSRAARQHASRAEVQPDIIIGRVEAALLEVAA